MWEWLCTVVLGIVEGFTEFLPVSSTGHLILTDELMGFREALTLSGVTDAKTFASNFEVIIQLGAILAVVAAYPGRFVGLADLRRHRGFAGIRGVSLLLVTSIPAAILGLLFDDLIEEKLFAPLPVTIALAVGAFWILFVEAKVDRQKATEVAETTEGTEEKAMEESSPQTRIASRSESSVESHAEIQTSAKSGDGLDQLTWRQALGIGMFQCLALWPGMSRSGSTILGAMMIGVDRKTATEYSFFAAVPVMFGATLLKVYKNYDVIVEGGNFALLAVGFVVSFFSAWIAVKWFIRILGRHTLRPFGWYRLGLATFCFTIWLPRIL